MKSILIAIVLLGSKLPLLVADTNSTAQQLLISAKQQANLFEDQNRPFELNVDFVVQMVVPAQGHLTLKWKTNDQWWRRIVMGDFEQVDVRNGEKQYTSRNLDFTPLRILELTGLLEFAKGSEGLQVKKQKQRYENGVGLLCLGVEETGSKEKEEVCVNSTSHEILTEEWQESPNEKRIRQYADYFDFGGHRYPRKLQLLLNGVKAITATVDNLTNATFDQSLLVAPKGAIERRHCPHMKPPIAVKTPDPMYPKSASENKMSGDTTVAMTVLTDGSVTDIHLTGSSGRSLDEATLQTLKGWRFKPALCGTDPTVSDVKVVVSFVR